MSAGKKRNGPRKGAPNAGRPRIEFSPEQWKHFEALADCGCTEIQISAFLGVERHKMCKAVKERYGETFEQQLKMRKEKGLAKLLTAQFAAAMRGNATLLIWLGKQYLGQKDTQQLEHSGPGGEPLGITVKFVGVDDK